VREACRAVEPESLPRKSPRKSTVLLEENAAWIVAEEAVLLERQTGRRAKGLWKLPQHQPAEAEVALFQTVFPFTHHRVTLRVYSGVAFGAPAAEQRWFALQSVLGEAALPSGHKRALEALRASHFTAKLPH
jgi:hypothetical protein